MARAPNVNQLFEQQFSFRAPVTPQLLAMPPREELRAAPVSWRDRMKDAIGGIIGRHNAEMAVQLADFTPLGAVFAGNEARMAADRGGYGEAAAGAAMATLPIPAARGAGKVAREVAQEVPTISTKGIIAYHGSPHTFDRFSLDKIGTGEGAQAYGHGLYFAENEAVAKGYRDSLTIDPVLKANEFAEQHGGMEGGLKKLREYEALFRDYAADKTLRKEKRAAQAEAAEQMKNAAIAAEQMLRGEKLSPQNGSMYKVQINADPGDFLDYNTPLSKQPRAEAALAAAGIPTKAEDKWWWQRPYNSPEMWTNNDGFVRAAGDGVFEYGTGNPFDAPAVGVAKTLEEAQASVAVTRPSLVPMQVMAGQPKWKVESALREAGIPGIKYLDQGSRGAGDGSRNFVVFDDKLIQILKRYSWAPGMAIPAAAMTEYQKQHGNAPIATVQTSPGI